MLEKQFKDLSEKYEKLMKEHERIIKQNRELYNENFELKNKFKTVGTSDSQWNTFKMCLAEGLGMCPACINTYLSRGEFSHIRTIRVFNIPLLSGILPEDIEKLRKLKRGSNGWRK